MSAGRLTVAAAALTLIAVGCAGNPNAANIVLRKENQTLTTQVADLQRQNAGLIAQIQAIQSRPGSTVPQLPEARLDKLFTTHGLELGSLTGGFPGDPTKPDQMVKVYVIPTDDQGQEIKAAGSFVVELFDLAAKPDRRLGRWEFSTEQARASWYGGSFLGFTPLRTYVLDCPWQETPEHAKLTLKVAFTDELTGRKFDVQKEITIYPPGSSGSAPLKPGSVSSASSQP